MFNKKKSTESEVVIKAINFENTLTEGFRKSEKRAWIVAISAVCMAVLLVIGMMLMLPLKEKVPYLIMADPYTGTSSLSKITENFASKQITSNEAINKSNAAHFVIARESYDWDLINRRDWNTVFSMSNANISTNFKNLFADDNPKNPDKLYGKAQVVRVKIKTMVLTETSKGEVNGATVRFDRIIIDKESARIVGAEAAIATMAFEYKSNLSMAEDQRIENPLGFRVTAYRVDPEVATSEKAVVLKEISEQAVKSAQ
jgi:type IV secretion system protein VirB8